jgi:type II secretory ATPase GspE/PulE/Tfp pilus assembly ATPase PilB-like protein
MTMAFDCGYQVDLRIHNELCSMLASRFTQFQDMLPEEISRRASRAHFLGAMAELRGMTPLPDISKAVDQDLLKSFDGAVMSTGMMVPLSYKDNRLAIAIADPFNTTGIDYCVQTYPEARLTVYLTYAGQVTNIVEKMISGSSVRVDEIEVVETVGESFAKSDFDLTKEQDEPTAELARGLLLRAVQVGASDIHFKVEKQRFYYSYRIDGDLGPKIELPFAIRSKLDAFFILRAGHSIEAKLAPISGRFAITVQSRKIDIRYERHPTYRGFHVTMRLLDKSQIELVLGQGGLKFHPKVLSYLYKSINLADGMMMISGPTGSGKSSTVTAILRELNRDKYNTLTLENPVEEEIPGITHVQIDNANVDTFNRYMASFMRSDPDIIFIGEVRDNASASAALNASTTGHQVISTIHSSRASMIISRLVQLGLRRYDLAENLKAACAQRLVRTVCTSCGNPKGHYTKDEMELYNLPAEWADREFMKHNPDGCDACDQSGYKGRKALFEILPISFEIASKLADESLTAMEFERMVKEDMGLPLMKDLALFAVEEGFTDMNAVQDVVAITL